MALVCAKCGEKNADTALMCGLCGDVLQKRGKDGMTTAPTTSNTALSSSLPPPPVPAVPLPPRPVAVPTRVPHREDYVEGYEEAEVMLRWVAMMIDSLILGGAGIAASFIGTAAGMESTIAGAMSLPIFLVYYTALEGSSLQGTLGKKVLGLVVLDTDEQPIGYVRAFLRNLAKFLSASLCYAGFFMAFFTERKQGLHDMITGSLVMRKVRL